MTSQPPLRRGLPTFRLVSLALVLGLAPVALATELDGKVVVVLDGDTIHVLTPAREVVRVRLAGLDAPEKKQAFGNTAKQKLSDHVFSRNVTGAILPMDGGANLVV